MPVSLDITLSYYPNIKRPWADTQATIPISKGPGLTLRLTVTALWLSDSLKSTILQIWHPIVEYLTSSLLWHQVHLIVHSANKFYKGKKLNFNSIFAKNQLGLVTFNHDNFLAKIKKSLKWVWHSTYTDVFLLNDSARSGDASVICPWLLETDILTTNQWNQYFLSESFVFSSQLWSRSTF